MATPRLTAANRRALTDALKDGDGVIWVAPDDYNRAPRCRWNIANRLVQLGLATMEQPKAGAVEFRFMLTAAGRIAAQAAANAKPSDQGENPDE